MRTSQRTATALATVLLVSCAGDRADAPAPRADVAPPVAALLIGPEEFGSDPVRAADLRDRISQDPYLYFRFINKRWSKAVCDSFTEADLEFVVTSLHGDAHLSQYAITTDQRGLDDFDDSASGPAGLDIVRFLASVELVLASKGWDDRRDDAFDAFMKGYRLAIADPGYAPPEPTYAARLRSQLMSQEEFLSWAESLMEPFDEHARRQNEESVRLFGEMMLRSRPELAPTYFDLKSAGWLHIGVGSALTLKQLARMEGPTASPDDDIVLEAKELSDLSVIDGSRRVGRIRHDIMAIVPTQPGQDLGVRDWWVRSWAPSYKEIDLDDLRTAAELLEIVHDVGAQLGQGHRAEARETPDLAEERLARNEAWARREAAAQIRNLLDAWEIFRRGAAG